MAALLGEGEKWPNFRTDGQSQRQGHNIIGAHRARTEFFRIALKKNEDNAYLTILVQLTTLLEDRLIANFVKYQV